MNYTAKGYLIRIIKTTAVTVSAYFNDSQRQATKDVEFISELDIDLNKKNAESKHFDLRS
jgi:molecular chaperone DnaK (HSP70)